MSTESARKWRIKNPEKYAYNNIKNRAKQRNKPFTISFSYFLRFCKKYEYIKNKGVSAQSMTVDCKIPEKGYVPGNLQPLSFDTNRRKATKTLYYQWWDKKAWAEDTTLPDDKTSFEEKFDVIQQFNKKNPL